MAKALVSGEKRFISVIAPIIKSCGVGTVAGRTIRESLELHQLEKPDLVVMQERFEDGSGDDLMSELKKQSLKLMTVVVLNRRDVDLALRWMEAGAYECLYEPLNGKEVRAVIRGAVRTLSGTFLPRVTMLERFLLPAQYSFKYLTLILGVLSGILILAWGSMTLYQRYRASKPKTTHSASRNEY